MDETIYPVEGRLDLAVKPAHPCIRTVEMGVFRDCGHIFRLEKPEDLDEELVALLHEAYVIGALVG